MSCDQRQDQRQAVSDTGQAVPTPATQTRSHADEGMSGEQFLPQLPGWFRTGVGSIPRVRACGHARAGGPAGVAADGFETCVGERYNDHTPWLRVPVVPGIEPWGVVTGVLGLLGLAIVRLVSERRFRSRKSTGRKVRKEQKMNAKKKVSKRKDKSRSFWQYLAETIWTYGAGVMATHWPP